MNAHPGVDALVLDWQRGDEPGQVEFVVTDSYAEDLLSLLAERNVSAARRPTAVRGSGVDAFALVTAMAGNPAAWVAIGVAVKAFFDRHKGKRIQVGEKGITEAANYSAADIERIVRALSNADADDVEEDG